MEQIYLPYIGKYPENRIDQWGMSDKDFAGLKDAEANFKFKRTWQPA